MFLVIYRVHLMIEGVILYLGQEHSQKFTETEKWEKKCSSSDKEKENRAVPQLLSSSKEE